MKKTFLSSAVSISATALIVSPGVFAQSSANSGGGGSLLWVFLVGMIVALAVGGVIAWRMNQKELASTTAGIKDHGFGPDKKTPGSGGVVQRSERKRGSRSSDSATSNPSLHGIDIDDVKDKMEKIRFQRLPINRIDSLKTPRAFSALPAGDEEELLKAIEESDVEFVESEEVRDAALDVLAGFRTRNSVDAIAQMAIYDLSSTLRSKAVGILADIDHESVFESVILSCADPTREVRAAGAKALFKLSFNRADAWLRLAESADSYRVSQAAKAAIEADFVGRSLERLVHKDVSYAGEALALLALLIRAGETDELLDYLLLGDKKDVKLALLRVFKIVGDEASIEKLRALVDSESLVDDVLAEASVVVGTREEAVASE
ncbi:MAG: hypothetical protein J5I65_12625 [Aridibacter famidurans]|nr:hypothetical protein [Aridibacter famidurans]